MLSLASFNRWQAAGAHLTLSAVIGATVLAAMLFVWYPEPFFDAVGGSRLILLLVGVDVVLGPLLTLVVYNPRKPRLRLDLSIIAVLQSAALIYGVHVMFAARPVYVVLRWTRSHALARSPLALLYFGRIVALAMSSYFVVNFNRNDNRTPERR